MSKQGVKHVLAALISDPIFKRAFFANKARALRDSGYRLTDLEMEALKRLTQEDVGLVIKVNKKIAEFVVPFVTQVPPGRPKADDR